MQVSVIIPVYNAVHYIEEAVQSALIQPETAEIILVDDGSTDGSYEICQKLSQNPKVKLFTHPNRQNKRAGATRNLGIRQASSEFIAFLDADDYYLENRFAKAKEVFRKYPDADGTYDLLGIHYETEKGRTLFNQQQKNIVTSFSLKTAHPDVLFESFVKNETAFSVHTVILKMSSFVDELMFAEHLYQGQDTDFILKWIHNNKIYPASTGKAVTVYRIHDNNTTHNKVESCKFKLLTFQPWVQEIRHNQWSKSTNRALYRHLLAGVSCHRSKLMRIVLKLAYSSFFFIKNPWILPRLL